MGGLQLQEATKQSEGATNNMHCKGQRCLFGIIVIVFNSRDPSTAGTHWGIQPQVYWWDPVFFLNVCQSCSLQLFTGPHPPCVQRHSPQTISCEVNIPLLSNPNFAPWNGLNVPCFHPYKSRMRLKAQTAYIRGAAKIQPFHFVGPNQNGLVRAFVTGES